MSLFYLNADRRKIALSAEEKELIFRFNFNKYLRDRLIKAYNKI